MMELVHKSEGKGHRREVLKEVPIEDDDTLKVYWGLLIYIMFTTDRTKYK